MAAAFNITDFSTMCAWFYHLTVLLTSKFFNMDIEKSFHNLVKISLNKETPLTELEGNSALDTLQPDNTDEDRFSIFSSSPFHKKFQGIYNKIQLKSKFQKPDKENVYYNINFFNVLLKKYIPYLPLWSGLLLSKPEVTRLSNSNVENWFCIVKNLILKGLKNQKCSRVIREIRKRVLSTHTEIVFDISKTHCATSYSTKVDETSSCLTAEEKWNKKIVSSNNNFKGTYLKKTMQKLSLKSHADLNSEVGEDETSDCSSNKYLPKDSLKVKCEKFIKSIKLDTNAIVNLAARTVLQNLSELWHDERKKRLTSSNFSIVCKARSNES